MFWGQANCRALVGRPDSAGDCGVRRGLLVGCLLARVRGQLGAGQGLHAVPGGHRADVGGPAQPGRWSLGRQPQQVPVFQWNE